MSHSNETKASFFETLPSDLFPRLFSRIKRNALNSILLQGTCSLRGASRELFTAFHVKWGHQISFNVREKTITIGSAAPRSLVNDVVRFYGNYIETIHFQHDALGKFTHDILKSFMDKKSKIYPSQIHSTSGFGISASLFASSDKV